MGADSVSLALAGSGGAGVVTAGALLQEAAARAGWYALMSRSAGPQIRGGEAAALLRLASRPVSSHADAFDILVALDWGRIARFADEMPLAAGALVIGEAKEGEAPEAIARAGCRSLALPMRDIARGIPGGRPNMVALGAAARMIGLPEAAMKQVLEHSLASKGAEAVEASAAAFRAGMRAAADFPRRPLPPPVPAGARKRWNITGSEATALGALRGGVRFVAAYPITPATDVLEWLAATLPGVGGALIQAEDELAAINQVLGASWGGVPALTATSGPGLSLMTESIGLAVAAEVPAVIVDVQRGGPSTGIPTKSEQCDLDIALHGMHGEAPHLVVAPVSIADCLFATQWAVHLAESLQSPAIVLGDQQLGQAKAVIEAPGEFPFIARRLTWEGGAQPYRRYALTDSGISPMALPGRAGGQHTADGLEHDESGTPSSASSDHAAQLDKRARKLERHDYGEHWAQIEGEGDLALITWGSSTGPSREALERLAQAGLAARLVALRLLAPAQPEKLARALAGARRILVGEQSHSGQFHR
ncbi:MAG: 2-oxoacid:acceptor oxidoreductase subunit alpha [Rhodocyclaceae bacterium]